MWLSYVHLGFVCFSVVMIFLADRQAFAWLRGKKETLDRHTLNFYHLLTWIGLVILLITGALLLLDRLYLFGELLFIVKMLFVGILFVNAVLIGRLVSIATERPFRSLSLDDKMPLITSGAISALAWGAVIGIGFYLFGLP